MIPENIKIQIYQFLRGKLSIDHFEKWVYENKHLEKQLDRNGYLALIAFDFQQKDARYELEKLLMQHIIPEVEFDRWLIRRMLNQLVHQEGDPVEIFRNLYDLYNRGYGFLRDISLPSMIDIDGVPTLSEKHLWNAEAFEEKRKGLDHLMSKYKSHAESVLTALDREEITIPAIGKFEMRQSLNNLSQFRDDAVSNLLMPENVDHLSIIVAMDQNRLIGKDNRMPWHLPADMRWFRENTVGKPVIMGRKTYESIPLKFRPFPNRHNIILTRNPDYEAPGATVVLTSEAALEAAGDVEEIMIGGGTTIYELFMPLVNRFYLTKVNGRYEGDTYLPEFDLNGWQETFHEHHPTDGKNEVSIDWYIFDKEIKQTEG